LLTLQQDRIELLDAILKPPSSRIPPSALIRLSNDSDGMLMLNPTLTSAGAMTLAANANINGPLSPTHKDFILISQIIAEQIIFGSFGELHQIHEMIAC
jgi:hypothetical protein